MKNSQSLNCREYFKCEKKECPAYLSEDNKCWMISGTFCHDKTDGSWIEKMEACMACEVFRNNI